MLGFRGGSTASAAVRRTTLVSITRQAMTMNLLMIRASTITQLVIAIKPQQQHHETLAVAVVVVVVIVVVVVVVVVVAAAVVVVVSAAAV